MSCARAHLIFDDKHTEVVLQRVNYVTADVLEISVLIYRKTTQGSEMVQDLKRVRNTLVRLNNWGLGIG